MFQMARRLDGSEILLLFKLKHVHSLDFSSTHTVTCLPYKQIRSVRPAIHPSLSLFFFQGGPHSLWHSQTGGTHQIRVCFGHTLAYRWHPDALRRCAAAHGWLHRARPAFWSEEVQRLARYHATEHAHSPTCIVFFVPPHQRAPSVTSRREGHRHETCCQFNW